MAEFLVQWEVELGAGSAREAAELALRIQRDPHSRACMFNVIVADTGAVTTIDLED